MKEYTVKLTQNDNGTWDASTPKTVGSGLTVSEALRTLAAKLEAKTISLKPPDIAAKEAIDHVKDLLKRFEGIVNAEAQE